MTICSPGHVSQLTPPHLCKNSCYFFLIGHILHLEDLISLYDDQKSANYCPHILDKFRIYDNKPPTKIINKKQHPKHQFPSNIQHPNPLMFLFSLQPTPPGWGWVSLTNGPKDTCRAASVAYAFKVLTWCLFRKIPMEP